MSDRSIDQVVAECARYWRDTGVPSDRVREMRDELTDHLNEAVAADQSVDTVVGTELAAFAEEWATAYRNPVRAKPPDEEKSGSSAMWIGLTIGLIGIAFAAVAILAPKGTDVDAEQWRWIWIGAAVVLAVGELFTAGFFLLPFAVGAAAAAVLAFLDVSVPIQLVTFVVISVVFLAVLQRFARKEQDDSIGARAGANRFVGKLAIVIEPVKYLETTGMVRMGTEEWRATVDSDIVIPKGARVEVVEVRGTRLVVKPIPPTTE
jgi:membrane protein implicated in regulation of membrane protease activity